MKKIGVLVISILIGSSLLGGCGEKKNVVKTEDNKCTSTVSSSSSNNKKETENISSEDNKFEDLFKCLRYHEESSTKQERIDKYYKYKEDFYDFSQQFTKDKKALIQVPNAIKEKLEPMILQQDYVNKKGEIWMQFGFGAKKDNLMVATVKVVYNDAKDNTGRVNGYHIYFKQIEKDRFEILKVESYYEQEKNLFRMFDDEKINNAIIKNK